MLSVTLVMAVAFLAIARRETGSVDTQKDAKTAQLAAETGVARAQAQIAASMLASLKNGVSSNAYNEHLFVSTNYINPDGFVKNIANPTNVNYNGPFASPDERNQNIANLYFLPRAPVCIPLGQPATNYDFRFYLDLNENGSFEPNGWQPVISDNPNYPYYDTNHNPQRVMLPGGNVLSNFMVGDPEWVGVLEHPDEPHGPNNLFIGRYAFIALPAGNALDINYIHNQALNQSLTGPDGFMRNQGVGSWELNLASFLADLNTNIWSKAALPNNYYYYYGKPENNNNSGMAFSDARALLEYRYSSNSLPWANRILSNPNGLYNGIDNFSQGPLQTLLDYQIAPGNVSLRSSWSGAYNTNHYFSLADWLDASKTGNGPNTFTNHLREGGTTTMGRLRPTYDNYTFYRMLDEVASDSSPDDGKLNLNYSNAVVYADNNHVLHINIIAGAETNLMRWSPTNFFLAAADQMLRTYSAYWQSENYAAYTNTFAITTPFSITNIPVWVSNRFVYTPAVHRLLQLAANIYDASTNNNFNLPHVYRPLFRRVVNGRNNDIYIMGYIAVNSVTGPGDPQLAAPYDVTQLIKANQTPIANNNVPVNVYGVPWIIGAKKGLPNFNQFSLLSAAQVTRKLEISRTTDNPRSATYTTNQAYIVGVSNQVGVSFWNSYSNTYYPHSGNLRVVVSDSLNMYMTNSYNGGGYRIWPLHADSSPTNFYANYTLASWPGSSWGKQPPNLTPQSGSTLSFNWPLLYQSPLVYNDSSHNFANGSFEPLSQLDQLGLIVTNYLQAYILDGNNVIDYVQLRDPVTVGGLNQALADPNSPGTANIHYQWSTNAYSKNVNITYGVINQLAVSGNASYAPAGGQWSTAPTPMGNTVAAEVAFFNGFFVPNFQYNGKTYVNRQLAIQAPYTPSRTVYSSFLLQANDPLVHYTSSDLNSQLGSLAVWANKQAMYNGIWAQSDDPVNSPLPTPPPNPVGGRYQPWGNVGQLASLGNTVDNQNPYNVAYKDSLMWSADNWDFPTNLYPTVGWLGRVHRGTPWQTVYLKSTNILNWPQPAPVSYGVSTWAAWTGDTLNNAYLPYFDSRNSAPQQDFLLFDIFTTRYNDNGVRGTLPVNVGMGRSDGGLAAWSALFSGMTVLTNTGESFYSYTPLTYAHTNISPAGIDVSNSPLWKIVNGPNGINVTRANTNLFPHQVFIDAGQILATPALTLASPFLNATNSIGRAGERGGGGNPFEFGINDEMYEWLPQQMMGLVRSTEQRYVLYCFGQALRQAPNGKVLGSRPAFNLMVTNYQVTAESIVRAVIRVDNANTAQPHAVVESYNVLPPF